MTTHPCLHYESSGNKLEPYFRKIELPEYDDPGLAPVRIEIEFKVNSWKGIIQGSASRSDGMKGEGSSLRSNQSLKLALHKGGEKCQPQCWSRVVEGGNSVVLVQYL